MTHLSHGSEIHLQGFYITKSGVLHVLDWDEVWNTLDSGVDYIPMMKIDMFGEKMT